MHLMKSHHKNTNNLRVNQKGAIQTSTIIVIVLTVLLAVVGSLAIWAFVEYNNQKTDVDGKVALAVTKAEKDQAEEDEKKFAEREKEPNREFVGPDDYGRVTFDYPKTWSVYIDRDGSSGGKFEAYLNPIVVPPIKNDERFALRVTIEEKAVDQVLRLYESKIKKGDLNSTAFTANGLEGTRLDGNFSNDIRGSAVIFKVRDKVLTIRTDAETFKPDFEKLIKTIEFNQ